MKRLLITFVLAQLLLTGPATANPLVDTGPGPSAIVGWIMDLDQSLAAEFSLTSAATVTDVQGWFSGDSTSTGQSAGTATAAIYTDGGDIPGTEIFAAVFSAQLIPGWYGASGLNWALNPGTYWVAFEQRAGQTLDAVMPHPAITPLINEAFKNPRGSNTWNGDDNLNFGVRILSEQPQIPIPEPATLALLGLGLAGLGFSRRKQ